MGKVPHLEEMEKKLTQEQTLKNRNPPEKEEGDGEENTANQEEGFHGQPHHGTARNARNGSSSSHAVDYSAYYHAGLYLASQGLAGGPKSYA